MTADLSNPPYSSEPYIGASVSKELFIAPSLYLTAGTQPRVYRGPPLRERTAPTRFVEQYL